MIDTADRELIRSKRKAISTLFLYAVLREQDGQCNLFSLFLNAARASHLWRFVWRHVEPLVATILNEKSHVSSKRAVVLASPHLPWLEFVNGERMTKLWAAAASEVPYTDEVGPAVVDTLLQIASDDTLRPHIPVGMWSWLDKPRSLPPICWGRYCANHTDTVKIVRAHGNIETLKSYLLLALSEWDYPDLHGTCASIREDFSGIGMRHHREDLLRHLDHVLGELGLGLEHLQPHNMNIHEHRIQRTKEQYEELKAVLLEVDGEAMNVLTRESLRSDILFCLAF